MDELKDYSLRLIERYSTQKFTRLQLKDKQKLLIALTLCIKNFNCDCIQSDRLSVINFVKDHFTTIYNI